MQRVRAAARLSGNGTNFELSQTQLDLLRAMQQFQVIEYKHVDKGRAWLDDGKRSLVKRSTLKALHRYEMIQFVEGDARHRQWFLTERGLATARGAGE